MRRSQESSEAPGLQRQYSIQLNIWRRVGITSRACYRVHATQALASAQVRALGRQAPPSSGLPVIDKTHPIRVCPAVQRHPVEVIIVSRRVCLMPRRRSSSFEPTLPSMPWSSASTAFFSFSRRSKSAFILLISLIVFCLARSRCSATCLKVGGMPLLCALRRGSFGGDPLAEIPWLRYLG